MASRNQSVRLKPNINCCIIDEIIIDIFHDMVELYKISCPPRNIVHNAGFTGEGVVRNMITGHWRITSDSCRMLPTAFVNLCTIFGERGLLVDSRLVFVEEQVKIFLQTLGHRHKNRMVQQSLQHSSETISKYFNRVLRVPDIICPKESLTSIPRHIIEYANGKYYPFFKNAVGALDGTHVMCVVPKKDQMAYRCGRDPKHTTQNVLGVCDFNMRFTFVSVGWERTTHNCKVLNHAVADLSHMFPHPPGG